MPVEPRWIRWPDEASPRIAYGGDYNPEQWSAEDWAEDVRLMRQAGVSIVNVAIFAWSLLEPEDGVFDFALFNNVLDLLHENGIAVDLGTATSSPPAWLVAAHPEILPVDAKGHTLGFGGRQSWCPSSPVFREHSLRLVEKMAEHFGGHPALALWHVSNELGCHNALCYCPVSQAAFQAWLENRYGSLEALNDAWGTAFWSQRYTQWQQVPVPALAPTFPNPTQQLDFSRFCSDELLGQYLAERDMLHRVTPDVPVTTNFMVMSGEKHMDYAAWAREMDLVSNDHYLTEGDPEPQIELAFSADVTRGISRGRGWMLMEQSTSAVNWGTVNRQKSPGEMRRNSLAQVARGADAISFFQWRASRAGAEKFHSAMLPHAGADSRVFREVSELGADLGRLGEVVGTGSSNPVAVLHDWPSGWASHIDSHPSQLFDYRTTVVAAYEPLWRNNIGTDVLPVDAPFDSYRVLVVAGLYLVDDETAARVAEFAQAGGHVVVTYFSGVVDRNDHIRLGGYPGAFRDLLGMRVEEFAPLRPGQSVRLDDGSTGTFWSEYVSTHGAEVVASFEGGVLHGLPAVTRRDLPGGGSATYVATQLDAPDWAKLLLGICARARVEPVATSSGHVEVVRRVGADGNAYLFAINHGGTTATLHARGLDLLTGTTHTSGTVGIPAGDVAVLRVTP